MGTTGAKDPMSIRVVSRQLVKASDASIQPHVLSLSNLDLYVTDTQMCTVCVYPNAGGGGFSARIPSLFEALLPSLLNHLYPYAGRLVTNASSGLPELRCHNQGAELVVGEVGVALGSLDYGSVKESLNKMVLPFPKDVLLSVQVLSFACGGFSVTWSVNHIVGDGYMTATIVNTWSRLVRTGEIDGGPLNHDRSVFRPRSPPRYSDSIAATFTTYDEERLPNALTADASFVDRLYYVEASDIAALRDKAASTAAQRPTRVQALSAYLWKALADVVSACPRSAPTEHCRMGWWVSARRRLTAPKLAAMMPNYLGNVVTYSLGDAPAAEVTRKPLGEVAAMVRDAITSADYDELVQEMVDLVEVHKAQGFLLEASQVGVGTPTLNQSVMTTFPHDADFGFGQATLVTHVFPAADSLRFCTSFLSIMARPGGDGSWVVSAYIWPQLAAALESDGIFKPLTAEYLGLTPLTQQQQEQDM